MVELHPKICNICGGKGELINNSQIYGKPYDSGKCYFCTSCGAYVGTHEERPDEALGLLADAEMRNLRMQCHRKFDKKWKEKLNEYQGERLYHGRRTKEYKKAQCKLRRQAYISLAQFLGIPVEECHFGYFNKDNLKIVYDKIDLLVI